jgi:GxxExxY protein
MEVHRQLGHGFLELVYQTALALEFQNRGIPCAAEVALPIKYKGKLLTCTYRAGFICFKNVIVETKAMAQLTGANDAQLINQLQATGFHRGLLLNFGAPSLEHRRLVSGLSDDLRKSAQSVDGTSSQSAAEIYL